MLTWSRLSFQDAKPRFLNPRPGVELEGFTADLGTSPASSLEVWQSGDGSALRPYALEVRVIDDAGERWPTIEEVRQVLDAFVCSREAGVGAIFAPWGSVFVAGDDTLERGGPLVFVQGGAMPNTPAARRLELTMPSSVNGGAGRLIT